jgi:hypothetical protein
MRLDIFWSASAIVADPPDTVEQQVRQMGEYFRGLGDFIGETATNHPNEFVVAIATIFVASFTAVLAIATIRLWNSTADLVVTGERQLALTRETFVANQRPWIKVTVKAIEPLEVKADVVHLWLSIKFENIGNTPALRVSHVIWTHPGPEGGTVWDTYRRLSEFVKGKEPDPHRDLVVLFPGDSHVYKDYRALASWYKKQVDAGVQRGSERGLYFCVCVNYASSVGDAQYQTGFIFQPLRDDEALLRIDFGEPNVPLDRLILGLGDRPVGIFVS